MLQEASSCAFNGGGCGSEKQNSDFNRENPGYKEYALYKRNLEAHKHMMSCCAKKDLFEKFNNTNN